MRDNAGHKIDKREYKSCRDCGLKLGDVDLYLKGRWLYCVTDYMIRFGVDPSITQSPEQ